MKMTKKHVFYCCAQIALKGDQSMYQAENVQMLLLKEVIAQNEWTSLIIHGRRSGKFECTGALNKLRTRRTSA